MDTQQLLREARVRVERMIEAKEAERGKLVGEDDFRASDMVAESMGITDHVPFIRFVFDDAVETLMSRPPTWIFSVREEVLRDVIDAMCVSFISGLHHGYQLALMREEDA